MTSTPTPRLDDGALTRLVARYGTQIRPWLAELPAVLDGLAKRWHLDWGAVIPRGSMSLVLRCSLPDGRSAVLKVSPDTARLADEAAALESWATVHTPSVLALDPSLGALLLEAVQPGTPLVESLRYPSIEALAGLLTALHSSGVPDSAYPTLTQRVAHLFDSGATLYERSSELLDVVPAEFYERGRRLATMLAERTAPTALLHGDLTPSNILDGGDQRGLVAIDPAPSLGDDVAFDAVDLLLWQVSDVGMIAMRCERLAPAIGVSTDHLLDWCTAFAAMTALELGAAPATPAGAIQPYLALCDRLSS